VKLVTNIFGSSLGKKYVMAVSGGVLFLFVLGHLLGNLQVFLGSEAVNRYGQFLHSNPELLWPARVMLLVLLALHVWSATKLSLENKAARPVDYARFEPVASTYAARTMLMSGGIVFVFVIYHLLHFTAELRYLNLTGRDFAGFMDPAGRHDVFKMLVVGFSNGWVSAFYILGVALLCLHLSHGVSSMFQSLGWKSQAYGPVLDRAARLFAGLIFLGYTSIPVAILLGYGRETLK
jgi:succinate dehydrogenase / fumarate reductase cytochrome b subunit